MLNGRVHIERVDPLRLDLDTAEEIAAVDRSCLEAAGLTLPAPVGPSRLKLLQHQHDNRPVAGLWLARKGDRVVGHATAHLPVEDNTETAHLHGAVAPDLRGHGVGRLLLEAALQLVGDQGRIRISTGAFREAASRPALEAMGFSSEGLGVDAVRRVDLHAAPHGLWDRLHDEAAAHAADYELVHLVGPTPEDLLVEMAGLHAATNDAPLQDPEAEARRWDADRVAGYDAAMAARHQTVHRVLARHRRTGEWAGLSILCVDEFNPRIAFQEDTSVVRTHRGHRLGLLMKTDMLRWIARERPEIAATDTWNATTNHHMIAVNERLAAHVVAHHETYRLREG